MKRRSRKFLNASWNSFFASTCARCAVCGNSGSARIVQNQPISSPEPSPGLRASSAFISLPEPIDLIDSSRPVFSRSKSPMAPW